MTRTDPAISSFLPTFTDKQQSEIQTLATLLRAENAVLVTHYYTRPEIQRLAEVSDGFVGDSLAMARFGMEHEAKRLVIGGVKFMGETAKILSPNKQVLMPTVEATCSLDLSCPIDEFSAFCDKHPERTVVVYANTSAAVKARADWVVTSSNAIAIVDHLQAEGQKIIWGPDRHLGRYIREKTGADMLIWQGACIVHDEFKTQALVQMREQYPDAAVLAHPESPAEIIELADAVGSTTRLLQAAEELPQGQFIVATDQGIFYKMQQRVPHKQLLLAPTAGNGATCRSCGHCPWMAMNQLDNLADSLQNQSNEIRLSEDLIQAAYRPLKRMLDFY